MIEMRHLFLPLLACAVHAADLPLHPLALRQITCWLSDHERPVVTQFSLDAVERNENQFFPNEVVVENGLVRWSRGEETCAYRMAEIGPGLRRYEFFSNGGGTLTIRTVIDGRITTRDLMVDGKATRIRVFDVVAVDARKKDG